MKSSVPLARNDAELLRAIIVHLAEGVLILDASGKIVMVNPAAEVIFGRLAAQLIGSGPADERLGPVREDGSAWPPGAHPSLDTLATGKPHREVIKGIIRPDGSRAWLSINTTLVELPAPYGGHGVVASLVDVTSAIEAKRALQTSEQRFRDLTELSADWYWEQDAEFRFTYVSEGIRKVRGVAPDTLIGKRRWDSTDIVGGNEEMARHRATLEGHLPFRDFVLARTNADGMVTHVSHTGEPIFDDKGEFRGYRGVARDVTARLRAEEDLAHMAHYDALTGLPNRTLLRDRLQRAIARANRGQTLLAVMFLDLDQFKEINDSLGHAVGDAVLKEAALRLQRCLRLTDTVARLGGDEFTILLEDVTNVDEISRVTDKLLGAISERATVAGHELHLSTSIGVTVYPLDDQDADTLLRNADLAMYHAKQEGRNNMQLFARDMSERTEKRVDLLARLRGVLTRGELQLHYQPQVDVRSGGIIGVEALLRWNDPERGLVPPMQFIPLAEDTGLIIAIGEWVLREACGQAKRWLDAGLGPLTMAVNLSPRQFRQKNLVPMVSAILAETGLPAGCLELEITETSMMHRAEEAAVGLRALHDLGVRIALDDFGTGYSSLAYLHRFPVHTLKVDQSFVRDIKSDRDDAAIVSTVLTLARQMGLKALAEGVETEAQLSFLRTRGCDFFQGYLFCRPQPAREIEALLLHHRTQFSSSARTRPRKKKPSSRAG